MPVTTVCQTTWRGRQHRPRGRFESQLAARGAPSPAARKTAKARQFLLPRAMPSGMAFLFRDTAMTQCATPPTAPATRPPATRLNNEQVNRYKRHLILPEVGVEGQLKLLNAKVLCI